MVHTLMELFVRNRLVLGSARTLKKYRISEWAGFQVWKFLHPKSWRNLQKLDHMKKSFPLKNRMVFFIELSSNFRFTSWFLGNVCVKIYFHTRYPPFSESRKEKQSIYYNCPPPPRIQNPYMVSAYTRLYRVGLRYKTALQLLKHSITKYVHTLHCMYCTLLVFKLNHPFFAFFEWKASKI